MLVFVALEVIEIRLYEVIVQINTFKVGDGLIFGYVLRRLLFFYKNVVISGVR